MQFGLVIIIMIMRIIMPCVYYSAFPPRVSVLYYSSSVGAGGTEERHT